VNSKLYIIGGIGGAGQVLREAACNFVDGREAMVLLRMEGCVEVCVNAEHERQFPQAHLPVVRDADAFIRLYREDESRPLVHEHDACFCEKLHSIIAARASHCAFEWAFRQLRDFRPSAARLNFLEYHRNGLRSYTVVNTVSRLLSYSVPERTGYLISTIVKARNQVGETLRVQVASDTETAPSRMDFSLRLGDRELAFTRNIELPPDPSYDLVDGWLRAAQEKIRLGEPPDRVRDETLARVKDAGDAIDYAAVKPFIFQLFHSGKKEKILDNIQAQRHRLFDALVIVQRKYRTIEAVIEEEGLLPTSGLAPAEAGPAVADAGSPPALVADPGKLRREIAAFARTLASLRKDYAGKFVAIHDATVRDSDADEFALLRRTARAFPGIDVLVRKVPDGEVQGGKA
jgi:hypothetical protein